MDLVSYLTAGKGPDSVRGFVNPFSQALMAVFAAAPPDIQNGLRIFSGYRSPAHQAELFAAAVRKYGSEAAARKWVAPPGRSRHNSGKAADLRYASPAVRAWVHDNAAKFGLTFPMSWEPWHIELAGARGGPTAPIAWVPGPGGAPIHAPEPAIPAFPVNPTPKPGLFAGLQGGAGGGTMVENGPADLQGPSGPFETAMAADQVAQNNRQMSDFLLPNLETLSTSGKPSQNLLGQASTDPQAAEGIIQKVFQPRAAKLAGGGTKIRA